VSPPLIARSYLGDNTSPILSDLCAHLTSSADVELRVGPDTPGSSPDAAAHAHEFDLIWACGLMSIELMAAGNLDSDIVAAPVFAGEQGPVYHSVLVTRPETGFRTLAEATVGCLAVNEEESWSGHHVLLTQMAQLGLDEFANVMFSGSHKKSSEAVLAGEADVAAIDHTVWADLLTSNPALAALRVIDRTADWPAPPFSVRRSLDPDARARLIASLTAIGPGDIDGLDRIEPAHSETYATMRRL